jgi:hypothetical protein
MKLRIANCELGMCRSQPHGCRSEVRHSPFATRHCLAAFSLIECLTYISVFALFMILAMQVFFQGRDSSDRFRRSADDITRTLTAGERWREDIRTATGALRAAEENGQTWLVIPRGTNITTYTHFKTGVWRQEHTNAAWVPALTQAKSSRMEPDSRKHVTAWRWEVELQIKDEKKQTKPLFTFLGVVPSDAKP